MQISAKFLNDTRMALNIKAGSALLDQIKQQTLKRLEPSVKISGFRSGKAPLSLVEKNINSSTLQQEFIDEAVNSLYSQAIEQERIQPVDRPNVTIKKFVPFSDLEIDVEVDVVGKIELPDYKKIKVETRTVKVKANEIDSVIDKLRVREASKKEVKRSSKEGDEVLIDFMGYDKTSKTPISGAESKNYTLILGSNSFIPGFEDHLIGMKEGNSQSFDVVFPASYSVKSLQNKKVTFDVTVHKVMQLNLPAVDAKFVSKVSPFKTVEELKADIEKQLITDKELQARREHQNRLIEEITAQSKLSIPVILVDQEIETMERDERQNLLYQGVTWQEHLAAEGVTEEQHRTKNREAATARVKNGLALGEIARVENIVVTPEELDARLQILKSQYHDPQMQSELNKPASRREILSRILTEKTLEKLESYSR